MAEVPAPTPAPARPDGAAPVATRFVIVIIVATIAFAAGWAPGWLKLRSTMHRLEETRHELTIAQIQNKIASAAIDARRGEYEPARQAASQFFTQLRDEIDLGKKSALNDAQREEANKILNQRDDVITLLARSDPSAADRLTGLFVALRKLLTTT